LKNPKTCSLLFLATAALCAMTCGHPVASRYAGKPFSDPVTHSGLQILPGKVQCEYYDLGGEGTAFHDSDSTNSGSGGLNPADGSYLNEFRKNESVDISYTKMDDREIDNNPYNRVEPLKNQLYIGWTEPGEWVKYTVRVRRSGLYRIGLVYTSNRGGAVSLAVDGRDATGPLKIASTFDAKDPVDWRQWHHWNHPDSIGEILLEKGIHVLTLSTLAGGNMNYDFLEFSLKE
jgi:hypothetical protein